MNFAFLSSAKIKNLSSVSTTLALWLLSSAIPTREGLAAPGLSTDSLLNVPPDTIIDIGSRRELFVDEFLIADWRGVEWRLHSPIPREVAVVFDKPWEGSGSNFATVFRDSDRIRMYYIGANLTYAAGMKMSRRASYACYAESKDGIHWVKPELGLIEFNGSKRNNIILSMPKLDNFTPFKDSNPACPLEARYKAVGKGADGGLHAFKSADGIHWASLTNAPILTKGAFDTQNNAFWDPLRQRYWCYIRGVHDGIRDIRVATSTDFLAWTDPQLIEFADSPEEALYTNQVEPYYRAPHLFLGFPTRYIDRKFTSAAMQGLPDPMHRQRRMKFSLRYGTALTDGLFMSSRDGYSYHRWGDAFILPGPQRRNNWVYGDGFQSLGLLETSAMDTSAGKELSFYVGEDHWKDTHRLRRYTIRIDGFVSLHARQRHGEFITKPVHFSGNALSLNFATAAAGSIFVEFQDKRGLPLPGFSLSDSDELFGDTLDRTVTWNEKSDVRALIGKPIRIRMVLSEADLYSMKFLE